MRAIFFGFRSALEYLVPLLQWEKNSVKKASLKQKIDKYILRCVDFIVVGNQS